MSSIVILNPGSTGRNLIQSCLEGSSVLFTHDRQQDKKVFDNMNLSDFYLAGCDAANIYRMPDENIIKFMRTNEHVKILFPIRDLRDVAISRIHRGRPNGIQTKPFSDDATFEGLLDDFKQWFRCYTLIKETFTKRIRTVIYEELITDLEGTLKNICEFINIEYETEMLNFWKRLKHNKYKSDYTKLHTERIATWKNIEKYYGNFFDTLEFDFEDLFKEITPYLIYFNYETR